MSEEDYRRWSSDPGPDQTRAAEWQVSSQTQRKERWKNVRTLRTLVISAKRLSPRWLLWRLRAFRCAKRLWRRGWDSNPRYPQRHNGFRDRPVRPLRHPSDPRNLGRKGRSAKRRDISVTPPRLQAGKSPSGTQFFGPLYRDKTEPRATNRIRLLRRAR